MSEVGALALLLTLGAPGESSDPISRSSVQKIVTSCPKTHIPGPGTGTSTCRRVPELRGRWGVLPMTAAPARGTVTANYFTNANGRRSNHEPHAPSSEPSPGQRLPRRSGLVPGRRIALWGSATPCDEEPHGDVDRDRLRRGAAAGGGHRWRRAGRLAAAARLRRRPGPRGDVLGGPGGRSHRGAHR